ncbi:small RNA degrading nuclease 1-like [Silene latifolia]|uniref:small RNA degrading nuclease 1-like n=1 Tax=Silene latifolia TaxID=37657 RepID=UPI003D77FD8B
MEDKLSTASKDVLVHIVKLAQKAGMKGEHGDWKEFLKFFDKKFGSSMSDPSKRTADDLRAFVLSFKEKEDINYFARLMKSHTNREKVKQLLKGQDTESPEQRLVHLTLEHPHYSLSYSFPSHEEEWFVTKFGKKAKGKTSNTLLAVDCEMVLCEDGTEALVKICMVDRDLQIKLHEFVNPGKPVADYRTHITGVSAKDLEGVTFSIKDIQKSMRKLLSRGEILVGHSLSNDLKAMKVDHAIVIDTSFIFKYGDESTRRRPSLNDLCKTVLGYELRKKGASHNCVDDACAAMKLVLAKIENGNDDVIPVAQPDVPEVEKAKLLVHRIPNDLASEELKQVICGDFTIEIQASKNGKGKNYSAFAIFENPQEALNAYENLQGEENKDSYGRPQKLVSVQLKSGLTSAIYVRKMTLDNSPSQVSAKRSSQTETSGGELKRLKTDHSEEVLEGSSCVDHELEIKRLKKLVEERDEEISRQQNILTALTRKQGL